MFSELKSLTKHSSVYAFSAILRKAIGFIMIPIYTRYLTPADYGLIELLDLTLTVSIMLIGMRLGAALIRLHHKYDDIEQRHEVFSTAFIATLVLSVAVLLILQYFSSFFAEFISGSTDNTIYFQLIFFCLVFRALSLVPESYLLARKKSVIYSSFSVGVLISNLTLNIIFVVFMKLGVMGIVLSMVITKLLNGLGLFMFTLKDIKLKFSMEKFMEMLRFGLPLIPASFAMFAIHFSDRIFIQRFCSLEDVGLYALGYKFGMLLSVMISQPFFQTWNTQRFEILKTDHAPRTFGRFFSYYYFLIIFSGLGISLFINEAIAILATSAYSGATIFVPLIVTGYVLFGVSSFFTLGIMITYRTVYLMYIHLFVAAVNIGANYLLIQQFGAYGAALSTILTFFLLALISIAISQKLYPIQIEYVRIITITLASGITLWLAAYIHLPLLYSLISKTLLFFVMIGSLYLVGFFRTEEIEKIKSLIFRIPMFQKEKG